MKEIEENQLKESNSIDAKIESLLKKYGFKFWKGDPKGGSPNEDTIYDKTTEDGEWTIEYDLPLVRREDSQGIYWDSARTAGYHIYFYPREDKIDTFISLFNKKYKSKFKKKDLSVEQGFDLGYGLFNNEKEFLMKLEHELKKTENRVKDIFENITTSSITGMGEVTLPTATQTGSGDIPAGSGDAEKEYKKKKKKMKKLQNFESFVNEPKNKLTTNLSEFVNTNEGVFGIYKDLAKNAKDQNSFIKQFFKEFKDDVKKTKDTMKMAASMYDELLGLGESLVNEAFSRMSKDTIENELYAASQALTTYYDWLKAGNDSGKGESIDHVISLLKKCKSNIKRFNKPEEVKGTAFESVVNEAVSKSTKIYQIATPAPQSQLVYDLEELFSVYTGTEYRTIAPDFKDDEGYESVLMFNLSKSDIKKIEDNIADVLIWEYSIKKGKTITESVANELVNESFSSFLFNSPNEFGEFMNSAPDKGETKYLVFAHNKVNFNGQEIKLSGGYGIGSATSKSILGIFDNEQSAKDAYKAAMKKPEGNFVSFTMGTLLALTKFRSQYTEIEGHLAKIKIK